MIQWWKNSKFRWRTYPSSQSANNFLPFLGISHDDFSAFIVVSSYTHLKDIVRSLNAQCLVDFKLNGETVTIPAESSLHMISLLMSISSNYIFNCTSQDVPIVRQSSCKWWTIIECISVVKICGNIASWKVMNLCKLHTLAAILIALSSSQKPSPHSNIWG